jgi:hypothetical protein
MVLNVDFRKKNFFFIKIKKLKFFKMRFHPLENFFTIKILVSGEFKSEKIELVKKNPL